MSGRTASPEAKVWMQAFGARVRDARTAAGLSQEKLAERAEVHRTYIGSVERGEQNVSLVLMHLIARALDVSPVDLL